MNNITKKLLELVSDYKGSFDGAYNIRENGECAGRQSSKNIIIEPKLDKPGIDVTVKDGTKGEVVYIPSCVTMGGIDDVVYNDFHIGKDCDIKIISGCGVHTEDDSMAKHNGIHHFFLAENAKVHYEEKHVGTGDGKGIH